jgi:hypothetical protein
MLLAWRPPTANCPIGTKLRWAPTNLAIAFRHYHSIQSSFQESHDTDVGDRI